MATTQAKAGLHNTRQLLDELDALMGQMLALPVEDPESDDQATVSADATPTVSATLTMLEPSAPRAAEEPGATAAAEIQHGRVTLSQSAEPEATAPSWNEMFCELDQRPSMPAGTGSAPVLIPVVKDVAAPDLVEPAALPGPVPTERWRPGHLGYQFLLWVNHGYDHGTTWLGKPGRLLRSRHGKAVLGWAGFGLLALALAWLCSDWLAWNW